ncbi:MAG: glycosyltransferase family 25 protein [Pseudomonadota bacterium]
MKIFVINLERDIERKEYIINHFQENGVGPIELVTAVDGNNLSTQEIETYYSEQENKTKFYRSISRGEIGCALSHLHCYKYLLNSKEDGAFIFEDDCRLNKYSKEIMRRLTNIQLSEKALVLLTYASHFYKKPKIQLNSIYTLYKTKKAFRSHGYYITRKAAENMLHELKQIHKPFDQWRDYDQDNVIDLYNVAPFCVSKKRNLSEKSNLNHGRHQQQQHFTRHRLKPLENFLKLFLGSKSFRHKIQGAVLGIHIQSKTEKHFE